MSEFNCLPQDLQQSFSLHGEIPIFYPEQAKSPQNLKMNEAITKKDCSQDSRIPIDCLSFQHYINMGKVRLTLRGMTDLYFYEVLEKYKDQFSGKSIACLGTGAVWYAGVLCAHKIYATVIDDHFSCHNSGLDMLTFQEYEEDHRRFDFIFSFSHVAQEGLGCLEAPFMPDGDLKAMNRLKTMLKENGTLFLSIPVGIDHILWKKHRTYGSKRLPKLFDGWRAAYYFGCTPEDLEVKDTSRLHEPIFALKPLQTPPQNQREKPHPFDIQKIKSLHFHKSSAKKAENSDAIDEILKNRMILCTGSAFKNRAQLIRTSEFDAKQIPFKKIYAAVDDPNNLDVTFKNAKSHISLIPNLGSQYDGINCIIGSIKNAVNDPESLDDDIIIFRHETLFIYDMDLVKRSIAKFTEGYNVVARFFTNGKQSFYVTGSFFLRVSAARPIFKDHPFVTQFDKEVGTFCEDYLTQHLVNKIPNQFIIHVSHPLHGESELGFYHYPSGYLIPDVYRMNGNPEEIFK